LRREVTDKLRPIALSGMDVRLQVNEKGADIVVPLPAPVSVIPHIAELTTRQAADFLKVSRPHLVGLIDKGEIAHRMVGTHRRILVSDLIAYKAKSDKARRAAIAAIVAEAQEHKLP
jgi:excisionase family DNA binding protein